MLTPDGVAGGFERRALGAEVGDSYVVARRAEQEMLGAEASWVALARFLDRRLESSFRAPCKRQGGAGVCQACQPGRTEQRSFVNPNV
jgi:hypothetical protein